MDAGFTERNAKPISDDFVKPHKPESFGLAAKPNLLGTDGASQCRVDVPSPLKPRESFQGAVS